MSLAIFISGTARPRSPAEPAPLGRLVRNGPLQRLDRRQQALPDGPHGGDMHRGRERVVGRLAQVDVVVGVHRSSFPAITSSATFSMSSAFHAGRRPARPLTTAAAFFTCP
jgi:hypothetical protein